MLPRAREIWEGLGRQNQIVLAVSAVGILAALIGFIAWARTPEFVPLASGLSAQDAGAIRARLEESNVPYKFSQGGKAIQVPVQYHDEVLMKLASEGLPAESGASLEYDILKLGSGFGDTQSIEGAKLKRTHESQIARIIMGLEQVQSATVLIAPGNESPFARDTVPPSASVVVRVKPGKSLSEENVRAIVRITQMAYTGLTEKSITVADQSGETLHDGSRAGNSQVADNRMKAQHQEAQAKRIELQAALDRTLGPNKSVVLVNVELTSDQEEIKSETTEAGAVTATTTETETMTGAGQVGSGGVPGTNPNIAAGAGQTGVPTYARTTDSDGNYRHESTTKTTEPSRTVRHVVKGAGRFEKITVSALIDESVSPDQIGAIETTLKTIISASPGDASRQVTVQRIKFDRSAEDTAAKEDALARSAESRQRLLALAVPLGIMLLTFFLLARALRKPGPKAAGAQLALSGAASAGATLGGGALAYTPDGAPLSAQAALTGEDILGLPSGPGVPRTFEVIEQAFDANLESILHLAKSKPEMVALLVKSWISQDE